MASLTTDEKLNLQKMVSEMGSEDNTATIRRVKHSILLRDEIKKLDTFKMKNEMMKTSDNNKYTQLCKAETPFLYNNYTDIFNRIIKDELDLEIMTKLLIVLKLIEDGKVDQHEGSVMIGKVLKELYVDSALKQSNHLDEKNEKENPTENKIDNDTKPITWKEYKKIPIQQQAISLPQSLRGVEWRSPPPVFASSHPRCSCPCTS